MAYLIQDDPETYVAQHESPCPCGCGWMIEPGDNIIYDLNNGWVLYEHPEAG